jgi:prepilin-type N-terminal cleavage/methylation domain-containing protein
MNINTLWKLYNQQKTTNHPDQGFTLIELLLAILISGFVISGIGVGLVVMTRGNATAEGKTTRRVELNRAMDYIAEEVRMAKTVEVDSNELKLTVPATGGDQIIYYKYQARDLPSEAIWMKDGTIKRKVDSGGYQIILDGIASSPSGTFTCSSPNVSLNTNGFKACITDQRTVELRLYGNIPDPAKPDSTETIEVTTRVTARSSTPSPSPSP